MHLNYFLLQMSYQKPDANKVQLLKDIANKMRIHSINMTTASNSGSVTVQSSSQQQLAKIIMLEQGCNIAFSQAGRQAGGPGP